jgi:hypothetical protein
MTAETRMRRKGKARETNDTGLEAGAFEATELLETTAEADEEEAPDTRYRRRSPPKPDREASSSWLERIESVFRIASLLAISGSAMLAAFQFYQGRIDDRKEGSVDLINRWQSSDAREAYAQLNSALEARLGQTGPITANASLGNAAELNSSLGRIVLQEWSGGEDAPEDWARDVDTVFNFYSEVEFCIRSDLCDAPLLTSYFGDEAISFWEYFQWYAEQKRKTFYPDYGMALENLVTELRGQ